MGLALLYNIKMLVFIASLISVIGFTTSLGAVPFIYVSETCCDKGLSFATINLWSFGILTIFVTPFLIEDLTMAGTFFFFGSFSIVGTLIMIFIVNETKGLTDNECQTVYIKGTVEQDTKILTDIEVAKLKYERETSLNKSIRVTC